MRLLRTAAVCSLIYFASCAVSEAGCPPWRPCGNGNSWGGNRLVPQGFFGADFRPACACHDACLQTCTSRCDCDRQFLCNMQSACDSSCNPRACYRKARMYYGMARLAHMFQN